MSKTASGPSVARYLVPALLLLTVSGGQALAHRSPSNCNANRLTLSLDQNPAGNIVSGETVVYTVGAFNPGPGTGVGCDVTGATVTFTCPGVDGTPSGQTTVLGTGLSFPANNSGDTIFAPVSCKIIVNPGVTSATARAQAGQSTGNRTADLTKGVLHDSSLDDPFVRINDLTVTVSTCVAKVDKQVSCDGGKSFHDVGLVTADDDGHADLCLGWNAFTVDGTSVPAEPIQVRYAVANAGQADLLNCSIAESNGGFPATVGVGSLKGGACAADVDCGNPQAACVNGACVFTSGVNSADCSATLSAAEPDTATVTCDCTPTPGEAQVTAFDEASFQCQTPGLVVTKNCALQDASGNNAITITVQNTGTADLQNCTVSDANFTDAACPASGPPTGTSAAVAVSPSTIASLPAATTGPSITGTVTGLTQASCNTVSVACEIVGSVDPATGQPKTITATAQDSCEVQFVCPPFPFLVRTVGKVGNHGVITGSIGANDAGGDFHLGKFVIMSDGSTIAADQVGLGQETSVFNVLANTLRTGPGVVIRGSTGTPTLPLTSPFCPIPDFTCGGPDVTVPAFGSAGPLAPGSYGQLTVLGGGQVTLAPGTFEFCSVRTTRHTSITITGTSPTTIDVVGTFRLGNGSTLAPGPGTPTPQINVAGPLVRVGAGSTLQAFLAAPNAALRLGRSATIAGTFCVNSSHSDKNVTLICPPPP